MFIKLSSEEVILAVQEYLTRRGVPLDIDIDVFIRGGRKGNSGTAEVTLEPKVSGPDIQAPQTYQNLFPKEETEVLAEIVEDFVDEVAELEDDAFDDLEESMPDFTDLEEEELTVFDSEHVMPSKEVNDAIDSILDPRPALSVVAGKKTVGSMFNKTEPVKPESSETPSVKKANPFKR